MRLVAGMMAALFLLSAGVARAQNGAAPEPPPPEYSSTEPEPGPPSPPPNPAQGPYPYPYGAPQYPYGPPYGQAYAPPGGVDPHYALAFYESNKRSGGLALLIEFLIPGAGSIYGDHVTGAVITWGMMVGGVVVAISGARQIDADRRDSFGNESQLGPTMLIGGLVLIVSGRLYGFYDAWAATKDYNVELAQRMGLPPMALGVTPIQTAHGAAAWAPTLTLRF